MSENPFDRGTSLTIFQSDRMEDFGALIAALLIAIGIVFFAG